MPGRLGGKVAVITGGASGIGRETARRFAEEDAHVTIVDLADEPGNEVARELEGLYVHADVTDPGDVERMYRETAERFGGIDVLFNNAGISPPDDDSILETGLEAWERVQNVNLKSVFLCCKYGIPHLLERGGGSV
ncbi:MAG: SDR family NAD(P)-dependent oxidoreductase, partial [Actinomycetota bacterium]|nr:SDR family NAD(P)-dependent oxidoreductase [Actinomycetota bacterium]